MDRREFEKETARWTGRQAGKDGVESIGAWGTRAVDVGTVEATVAWCERCWKWEQGDDHLTQHWWHDWQTFLTHTIQRHSCT